MKRSLDSSDASKDEIDTLDEYHHVYSSHCEGEEIKLATLDWFLNFCKRNENNEYHVGLQCGNDSTFWNCDVELKAKFMNGSECQIVKAEQHCSSLRKSMSLKTTFENVPNNVSVDVWIKVKNVKGVRRFPRFDLLKKSPELADVTLVFDNEKKLNSSKMFLAHFSPFFHNLFFGNFAEKNQREVQLKDVDFDEFVDLMTVINPGENNITDDNIEHILKLADRFDMQSALDQCEDFLVCQGFGGDDDVKMLILADKYLLIDLQEDLIQCTTEKMLKEVLESELYPKLSDSTKMALFGKACQLLKVDQSEESDEN